MSRWKLSDVERIQSRGTIVSVGPVIENDKSSKFSTTQIRKIPAEEPKPLTEMKLTLRLMKINYQTEYVFSNERKFRFDIAMADVKVAIEYEGLFSDKSRHTSVVGYSRDTEKYNLATIEGWKVLRYTSMNYKKMFSDLIKIYKNQ